MIRITCHCSLIRVGHEPGKDVPQRVRRPAVGRISSHAAGADARGSERGLRSLCEASLPWSLYFRLYFLIAFFSLCCENTGKTRHPENNTLESGGFTACTSRGQVVLEPQHQSTSSVLKENQLIQHKKKPV